MYGYISGPEGFILEYDSELKFYFRIDAIKRRKSFLPQTTGTG